MSTEIDYGWHTDPWLGSFRVSFAETDGVVYAYLVRVNGDVILARNCVIGQVSDAFAGWSEEDRDLDWFKDRLRGQCLA